MQNTFWYEYVLTLYKGTDWFETVYRTGRRTFDTVHLYGRTRPRREPEPENLNLPRPSRVASEHAPAGAHREGFIDGSLADRYSLYSTPRSLLVYAGW